MFFEQCLFVFQAAFIKFRACVRLRSGCDNLGLSEGGHDCHLSSIHEVISLIALSFVGYTIRRILSFLSVALNDSAQALSHVMSLDMGDGSVSGHG